MRYLQQLFKTEKPEVTPIEYDEDHSIDEFMNAISHTLDKVMLTNGVFDYQLALDRLAQMKAIDKISSDFYLLLVDACCAKMANGDYTTSEIYTRIFRKVT